MSFTTGSFILFMAIVFFLYYIVPGKYQWVLLLAASYLFYAFESPVYLVFLAMVTLLSFAGGGYISKFSNERKKKTAVILVLISLIGTLAVVKYLSFIFQNISWIFGFGGGNTVGVIPDIVVPLGLSFYIFQGIGYVLDVYWGMTEAQTNFFRHALYMSFFPQLLQGPIAEYASLQPQLMEVHKFDAVLAARGLRRVAWGFMKKLVIANQISIVFDGVWHVGNVQRSFLYWVFVLLLYAIQLYADFSGYMDIALGCAQMLGITLDENFQQPYFSRSISEFWRRWHISLGKWFRKYVFYPLLRSRMCLALRRCCTRKFPHVAKILPTCVSLMVVWFLMGLWHGADWSYVLYGLYHGLFIVMETMLASKYKLFHRKFPGLKRNWIFILFQTCRTFLLVTFGYIIFCPADLSVTAFIINDMRSGLGLHALLSFGHVNIRLLLWIFIGTMWMFVMDLYQYLHPDRDIYERIGALSAGKRYVAYCTLLLFILFFGAYGATELNQFAYFRF